MKPFGRVETDKYIIETGCDYLFVFKRLPNGRPDSYVGSVDWNTAGDLIGERKGKLSGRSS